MEGKGIGRGAPAGAPRQADRDRYEPTPTRRAAYNAVLAQFQHQPEQRDARPEHRPEQRGARPKPPPEQQDARTLRQRTARVAPAPIATAESKAATHVRHDGPEVGGFMTSFTVRGDRGQERQLQVFSLGAEEHRKRNLLGRRHELSFSQEYEHSSFHWMLVDLALSNRELASSKKMRLSDYLKDDAQLARAKPDDGRRLRAHLLNIRNDPVKQERYGKDGKNYMRLQAVLELFYERLRPTVESNDAAFEATMDLASFISDLHRGKVSQVVPKRGGCAIL